MVKVNINLHAKLLYGLQSCGLDIFEYREEGLLIDFLIIHKRIDRSSLNPNLIIEGQDILALYETFVNQINVQPSLATFQTYIAEKVINLPIQQRIFGPGLDKFRIHSSYAAKQQSF